MAVFAQDLGFEVLVFLRHRRQRHLRVQISPQIRHVQQRHLACRARVMAGMQQFLETRAMKQVSAVGYVTRYAARVNVLEAHGAIGM